MISTEDELDHGAIKYPTLTNSEMEWLNNEDTIAIPMSSLRKHSHDGMNGCKNKNQRCRGWEGVA